MNITDLVTLDLPYYDCSPKIRNMLACIKPECLLTYTDGWHDNTEEIMSWRKYRLKTDVLDCTEVEPNSTGLQRYSGIVYQCGGYNYLVMSGQVFKVDLYKWECRIQGPGEIRLQYGACPEAVVIGSYLNDTEFRKQSAFGQELLRSIKPGCLQVYKDGWKQGVSEFKPELRYRVQRMLVPCEYGCIGYIYDSFLLMDGYVYKIETTDDGYVIGDFVSMDLKEWSSEKRNLICGVKYES